MLLLLGRSHLEAGSPLTGLPHILSCLLHCRDFHLDALVGCLAYLFIAVLPRSLWQLAD